MSNVDPAEIDKFSELAHRWWDPDGDMRPLHEINPLRLRLINCLKNGLSTATGQIFHEGVGIEATLEKIREVVLKDPAFRRYWEDLT